MDPAQFAICVLCDGNQILSNGQVFIDLKHTVTSGEFTLKEHIQPEKRTKQ